jgi:hypothetical protein
MSRPPAARPRTLATAALLLVTACAGPGAAQNSPTQPAPQRLHVTVVSVKPEMVAEYENMIRTQVNPALARAGAQWRDVWRSSWGTGFEYVIAEPADNIAQFDGPSALERALGEQGFAALVASRRRMINGVRTYLADLRPDMSYATEMAGPPNLAVVNSFHVAPGRTGEFESFVRNELLPVIRRSDVAGYWTQRTVFGGDPNEYFTLTLYPNFADLDRGPPLVRVLGREGAAELNRKLAPGVVLRQERMVVRFVPELSYRPAQAASR